MGKKQKRKTFTKEFKLDVIAQSYQRENILELASELGLRPALIYKWRAAYERDEQVAFPGKGVEQLTPEQQELARLKAENRELRMERDILKKAIRRVWEASRKTYGSPRIHRQLCEEGWGASRQRIARLMRGMGIASRIRRKWTVTTDSNHKFATAPNLLDRKFSPTELGQVWVSDITYLPSEDGWLQETTVMDLGDRQILGWSLSEGMSAEQTSIAAFNQAVSKRIPGKKMIFHSDQGSQYAWEGFTKKLAKYCVIQSMSRKGNCWDNAPAESFFKTLKYELDMPDRYQNYRQARAAIFEFIDLWYNRKRLHSALGYRTPIQVEQILNPNQAA